MRAQRQAIARNVAERLFAAEEALDVAAARIAELNAATETVKQTLGTNNDMFCGGADSRTR